MSLVMPVWRPHPRWFPDAVDSALAQTGCEIELVIVDDGNDDDSVEQLLGARVTDPRVRVVRIDHAGVSAARNAGTRVATGPFVRFVDADDVLPPSSTATLLALTEGGAIGNGATLVCDDTLHPVKELSSAVEGDAVRACIRSELETCHVSMLFPLDVARAAGPWDPALAVAEDWDFVLRCLELAPVRSTPEVVTLYRRHSGSVTRSDAADDAARHGQRRVIEKYVARHPDDREAASHARAVYHRTWASRAVDKRRPLVFAHHLRGLATVDPASAARVVGEAVVSGVRAVRRYGRRRG